MDNYLPLGTLAPLRSAQKCRDMNEFIQQIEEKYTDTTAFIIKHKKGKDVSYTNISFHQLAEDVRALGSAFMARGYQHKRTAILADNRYEWFLTYLAVLYIGGIVVPLDKGLGYGEFESSVQRSYADNLVYDKKNSAVAVQLKGSEGCKVSDFICIDEEGPGSFGAILQEGRELYRSGEHLLSQITIDPRAMAIILFTSGTTSLAKAVMLCQDGLVTNIYDMDLAEDVRPGDVNMAFLPYHHSFGSMGQLVMLSHGAATAFCDGLKYVQKNLVEYKVSVFVCVPLLIESL